MNRRRFLSLFVTSVFVTHAAAKDRDPMPVCRDPLPPLKFNSGPAYDPDHVCDKCGSMAISHRSSSGKKWTIVRDDGDKHVHRCSNAKCNNEWWHFDDGHTPTPPSREQAVEPTLPTYTLPQSTGNCPGGICPTQSRGLFRKK